MGLARMAKTPPDLSSVYLKLDRASEHMDTVSRQTKAFIESNPAPFDFWTKEAPGPGKSRKYVLRAIIRKEPPRELGLAIGDAIQNIRHALDHLVYELSTPSARNRGKSGFPIFTDKCEFQVLGTLLIKGIKGDERTLIERLQPYQAPNTVGNHPLAILNRLANKDKHRVLLPLISAVSQTGTWIGTTNADIQIIEFNPGPLKNNAKILVFTATPQDPSEKVHVQPKSGLQIQIADTGTIGMDLEVSELLAMLWHWVRNDAIDHWFVREYMRPEGVV